MKRTRRPAVLILMLASSAVTGGCNFGRGRTAPAEPTRQSRYVAADLPRGAVGLYAEGVLARRAGEQDRALGLLLDAVRQDQRLIMANQVLGEIYNERGDPASAQRFFKRLVDLDPDSASSQFKLGYTYELLRQFNDASKSYLAGLKIDAGNPAGNVGLGRTYLALGKPAEARPYLQTATQNDPTNGDAWFNLGRSLDALDALAAAENAYRRALETLPTPTPTLIENLGLNLVRQGKGQEAVPLLQQTVDAAPSARTHKQLGDAYVVAKDYDAATTQYDAALAADASYVPALNAKGTTLILQYQQGASIDDALREKALSIWRKSLEVEPDQPRVREAIKRFERSGLFE